MLLRVWGASPTRRQAARRALVLAGRYGLAALCGAALALTACAPFPTSQPGPYYPAISGAASPTPTVAPLGFTVAAWPSNSGPPAGAPVDIVVAFRDAAKPVAGASVSLLVQPAGSYEGQTYGPHATNAAGYAGFTLSGAGDQPDLPMLVQVTVSYQGQTYSTSTEFTPSP